MAMYKHIMTGLDLTTFDDQILQYLKQQNNWLQPQLFSFLHVSPSLEIPQYLPPDLVPDPGFTMEDQVKEKMDEQIDAFFPSASYDSVIREGPVTKIMLKQATKNGVDLDIIGRKQAHDFAGLGAKRFIRHASSDVLVVPSASSQTLRRIVVATDFSTHSDWALRKAIEFATILQVEIVLLHIFEVPPTWHNKVGRTQQQFDAMIRANLEDYLDKYLAEVNPASVEITPILLERDDSSLAQEIARFADHADADLLMMGVKGHRNLETFLMGSITEKVLNPDAGG